MKPFPHFSTPDRINTAIGTELLQAGKVGAIILAGGQASRLGIDAPKGTLPVTPIKQKSLFQLFAEKQAACSKMVQQSLPLAIMTSSENDAATRAFFEAHDFFGVSPEHLFFFQQGNLPLLDEETRTPLHLEGPNGNGSLFWNFREIALQWQQEGIEYVTVSLIDNALADPWSQNLLALHALSHNDVTLVAIEKTNPDEKVGLLVQDNTGKIAVVEYTEMHPTEKEARDSDGRLTYRLANISTFCFSLSSMIEMSERPIEVMPQHAQKKFSKALQKWIIKSEYFIFDALQFAKHPGVLLLDRKECFAPLKNSEGSDSLVTVQEALTARDRRLYESISGVKVAADRPFELSSDFQYPTEELRARFQGHPLPAIDYIT